ncbi:hypothetical protein ScPMuIL_001012 [Solemya velum]
MDLHIHFNVAMVIAAILGEVMSILWYSHHSYWGRHFGERYLLSAIVSDAGLVIILKWITEQYWSVGGWEDAAMLSMWLALLYACLEAPHCVCNANSFSHFFFHTLHKFCIMILFSDWIGIDPCCLSSGVVFPRYAQGRKQNKKWQTTCTFQHGHGDSRGPGRADEFVSVQ